MYFLVGLIYMNFNLSGNCFCQTKAAHVALGPLVWWIFIPVFHIDVRDIVKLNRSSYTYTSHYTYFAQDILNP